MDLIDWPLVGFGALWIFGLSLNLAALSLAEFERQRQSLRFRDVWAGHGYQVVSNLGLACFCLGLAGLVDTNWEGLVWGVLGAGFAIFAVRAWRTRP